MRHVPAQQPMAAPPFCFGTAARLLKGPRTTENTGAHRRVSGAGSADLYWCFSGALVYRSCTGPALVYCSCTGPVLGTLVYLYYVSMATLPHCAICSTGVTALGTLPVYWVLCTGVLELRCCWTGAPALPRCTGLALGTLYWLTGTALGPSTGALVLPCCAICSTVVIVLDTLLSTGFSALMYCSCTGVRGLHCCCTGALVLCWCCTVASLLYWC